MATFSAFLSTALCGLCLSTVGCRGQAAEKCERLVSEMQMQMQAIDPHDKQDVAAVLEGLGRAKESCQGASDAAAVADMKHAEKNFSEIRRKLEKMEQRVGPAESNVHP